MRNDNLCLSLDSLPGQLEASQRKACREGLPAGNDEVWLEMGQDTEEAGKGGLRIRTIIQPSREHSYSK